jgi:hypothetical protein
MAQAAYNSVFLTGVTLNSVPLKNAQGNAIAGAAVSYDVTPTVLTNPAQSVVTFYYADAHHLM